MSPLCSGGVSSHPLHPKTLFSPALLRSPLSPRMPHRLTGLARVLPTNTSPMAEEPYHERPWE